MNSWLYGTLVVTTTALMGSSFAVGKIGLHYVSPFLLVGIRFVLAGILMAIFTRSRPLPRTWQDWGRVALIGLFQTAGVMGAIFLSLRTITAGEASILTFVNPLLVAVLSTWFLGSVYRPSQWAGVVLGFVGVFFTLGVHLSLRSGTLLGLAAAVSWSVATLLIKLWGQRFDIWALSAYQMLAGGIILLAAGVILETPRFVVNAVSVSVILWLAVMASIVQFTIWLYLLHHGDPGKTSAFLFLAPFFGVLAGWLILHETIAWYVYLGGLLIIVGIFLVNWTFQTGHEPRVIQE